MKILIIEDEPSLRELIQRSLEKERYVVEAAADFQSGLRKIEDYDYDCVLLDIMLPDGNGLNLLEQLKKMRKRENVIIISAKDSLDDKVLGLIVFFKQGGELFFSCLINGITFRIQCQIYSHNDAVHILHLFHKRR